MTLPTHPFLTRIAKVKDGANAPLGSWLMTASPLVSEAMGVAGFDFLVVDMEHVPIDVPDMVSILHALSGTPAAPVVRLPWNDLITVKRVLDAGARTVMFPFVQNAEEAARAVSYTRYPPHGVRGVAAMHRGSRFGTTPDYLRQAHQELVVIVQLESPEALAQLEVIAAVPGVDAIFVGPGDLSAAMGYPGDITAAPVQAALQDAARRCRAVGKPCGIVGGNVEVVRRYIEWGYDFVAVASDLAMVMREATSVVQALGAASQSRQISAAPY